MREKGTCIGRVLLELLEITEESSSGRGCHYSGNKFEKTKKN